MSDSPTPETDGLETHKAEAVCRLVVPSIFARRLERERDEASRERGEVLSHIFDPATQILASSVHPLDLVMAGIEPQANAYLIDRRWLTYGQTYRELTPAKADVIRRNAERFVKVVNAAREEVSVLKANLKEEAK